MKRAREEEEGQQQEQEQNQGAPMAASPARSRNPNRNRRGPAAAVAATPSETGGTGEGRVRWMTIFDADDFVMNVKDEFEPEKYQQFLHVACQVFMRISTAGVVDGLKPLFRGHPGLTRQLNRFLPARYQLSEEDDQLPEEVPDVYSLQGSPRPPSQD